MAFGNTAGVKTDHNTVSQLTQSCSLANAVWYIFPTILCSENIFIFSSSLEILKQHTICN